MIGYGIHRIPDEFYFASAVYFANAGSVLTGYER